MQIFLTHIHIFVLALTPGAWQPGSKNAFSSQILTVRKTATRYNTRRMAAEWVCR